MSLTTCHIVSDSHSGEGDHNKVDGLQRGPALDVFEDNSWDGDKDDTAGQDEQDGGRHSDLGLTDLPVFLLMSEIGQVRFGYKGKKQAQVSWG